MNKELVWFLLPIASILWAWGGTGFKPARRLLLPLLLCGATLPFGDFSWWILPAFWAYFFVIHLPFTLKGDSIDTHWFNWVWIWILGALLGFPAVFLAKGLGAFPQWWAYSAPFFVLGILGTLSNTKRFREYVTWKFVELMVGGAVAFPLAMIVQALS